MMTVCGLNRLLQVPFIMFLFIVIAVLLKVLNLVNAHPVKGVCLARFYGFFTKMGTRRDI